MEFDIAPVLTRYAADQDLPMKVVREHERELKRYLALCAINRDGFYGMRGPIDELWHTFVVFTKLYMRFCDNIAGEMIHHFPNVSERKKSSDDGRIVEAYKKFLADYEVQFGESAPVHLWPRPMENEKAEYTGAGCVCGCGCRCIA